MLLETPTSAGAPNLLPEVIACLRQQVAVISKQEGYEPSLFEPGSPDDNAEEQPQASGVDALAKLVGETVKQFPHDFVDSQASKCLRMKLPEASLRLEQDCTGAFFLRTEEGHFCAVRNQTEANFILYAQLRGQHDLSVPIEMFQIFRTVKTYESYLRTLRAKLFYQVLKQARQKSVANYETDKLFRALGLPKLEQ